MLSCPATCATVPADVIPQGCLNTDWLFTSAAEPNCSVGCRGCNSDGETAAHKKVNCHLHNVKHWLMLIWAMHSTCSASAADIHDDNQCRPKMHTCKDHAFLLMSAVPNEAQHTTTAMIMHNHRLYVVSRQFVRNAANNFVMVMVPVVRA